MKKRYIILAIACVEILALPAAAQKLSTYDFSRPTIVAASKLPDVFQTSNAQRYLVTSDGPFAIVSENAVSDFEFTWILSGQMGDTEFGTYAKLPGEPYYCTQMSGDERTVILDAPQGTIDQDAEVIEQAVFVEIRHSSDKAPKIKFISDRRAKDLPRAQACPDTST